MGGQHFGLFNTGTITISLQDENDNSPYFTENSVSIYLCIHVSEFIYLFKNTDLE